MAEGRDHGANDRVRLTLRCKRSFDKLARKHDSKLLDSIRNTIDKLGRNPYLGKALKEDLKGMYSVCIKRYEYRIVYEIEKDAKGDRILVYAIGHRRDVYTKLSAYMQLLDV